MLKSLVNIIKKVNPELVIWIGGLLLLFLSQRHEGMQFTFCPLKLAGFEHCPGCGLGASIGLLLNGHPIESFHAHPLGGVALIVISFRIFTLIKNNYGTSIKTSSGTVR